MAGMFGGSKGHRKPPSYCQSTGISILNASAPVPCWSTKLTVFSLMIVPVEVAAVVDVGLAVAEVVDEGTLEPGEEVREAPVVAVDVEGELSDFEQLTLISKLDKARIIEI